MSQSVIASPLDMIRGRDGIFSFDTKLDRMVISNIGVRNYKINLQYRDMLGYNQLCQIFTMSFTEEEASVSGIVGSENVGSIQIGPHEDSIDFFRNIILRDRRIHVANRSRTDFTRGYNIVRRSGRYFTRLRNYRSDREFEVHYYLDHSTKSQNERSARSILQILGRGSYSQGINNLRHLLSKCRSL